MFRVMCLMQTKIPKLNNEHSEFSTLHHRLVFYRFKLTVKLQASILESWSFHWQIPLPSRYRPFVIFSTSVQHLKGLLPSGTESLLRRRQASNGQAQAQPSWHRCLKQPMVGRNTSPTPIFTHGSTCYEDTEKLASISFLVLGSLNLVLNV